MAGSVESTSLGARGPGLCLLGKAVPGEPASASQWARSGSSHGDRRDARGGGLGRAEPRGDEPVDGAGCRGARVQAEAWPRLRGLPAGRRRQGSWRARGQGSRPHPDRRRAAIDQVRPRAAGWPQPADHAAAVPLREHRRRDEVHQPARPRAAQQVRLPCTSTRDSGRVAVGSHPRWLGEGPRRVHRGRRHEAIVASRTLASDARARSGWAIRIRFRRSRTSRLRCARTSLARYSRWRPGPARR